PPRCSTGGTRATGSTSRRTPTSPRSTSGRGQAGRRGDGGFGQMRWIHTPIAAGDVAELSKRAGVGPVLAEFLNPDLSALGDPLAIANIVPAVARLKAAIAARERVIILGDYDVDGVSS